MPPNADYEVVFIVDGHPVTANDLTEVGKLLGDVDEVTVVSHGMPPDRKGVPAASCRRGGPVSTQATARLDTPVIRGIAIVRTGKGLIYGRT
jgi:hypothetical protein